MSPPDFLWSETVHKTNTNLHVSFCWCELVFSADLQYRTANYISNLYSGWVMWNREMMVQDTLLRPAMKRSARVLLFFLVVWTLLFLFVTTYFSDQTQMAISISYSDSQHVARDSRELKKIHLSRFAERRGPFQSRRDLKLSDSRYKQLRLRNIYKMELKRNKMKTIDNTWLLMEGLWKGNVSSNLLNQRLQQVIKDYVRANTHKVLYKGRRNASRSGQELLCQMKRQTRLKNLDSSEQPFFRLDFQRWFPSQPLQKVYKTCAVVSSAGSILNSLMGREIGELDRKKNCRKKR